MAQKRNRQERMGGLQAQLDAAKATSPAAAAAADALVDMDETHVLEGVRPGQSSGVPLSNTQSIPAKSQGNMTAQTSTNTRPGTTPVPQAPPASKTDAWHTVSHTRSTVSLERLVRRL